MKKTLIFLILLLFIVKGFSQTISSTEFSKEDYLKKSKNQKTTGWILLGGGVAMAVIGAASFSSSWDSESNTTTDISGFSMLGGVASSLVSIPFFISSGRNARKASKLSLNYQPILVPNQVSLAQNTLPSLSLTITF